jgi:hypothetical protein
LPWTRRSWGRSSRHRSRCSRTRPDRPTMADRNVGRLHPLGYPEWRPVYWWKSGNGTQPGFVGRTNSVFGAVYSEFTQTMNAHPLIAHRHLEGRCLQCPGTEKPPTFNAHVDALGVASNAPPTALTSLARVPKVSSKPFAPASSPALPTLGRRANVSSRAMCFRDTCAPGKCQQ